MSTSDQRPQHAKENGCVFKAAARHANTHTGPNRLKGGLEPGWTLNHKTGTGQELGAQQAGYNDIGILTAPDGRSYSVAVMIKLTSVPLPVRMTLMNNVVRAVITQHEMLHGTPYASQR